jgi:hypothetical protein
MTEKPEAPADGGTDGGGKTNGGGSTNGGGKPDGGGKTDEGGMNGGGDGGGGGGKTEPDPHQHSWEDAQSMMLKGMPQDEKNAYFQSEPSAQDAAVQAWHQENFGTNTSTDMPKGGPVVEGKYMPGGSEFGKGSGG